MVGGGGADLGRVEEVDRDRRGAELPQLVGLCVGAGDGGDPGPVGKEGADGGKAHDAGRAGDEDPEGLTGVCHGPPRLVMTIRTERAQILPDRIGSAQVPGVKDTRSSRSGSPATDTLATLPTPGA